MYRSTHRLQGSVVLLLRNKAMFSKVVQGIDEVDSAKDEEKQITRPEMSNKHMQ